jgi:casein kinase 1
MKDIEDLRIDLGNDIKKMEASLASAQKQVSGSGSLKVPRVGEAIGMYKVVGKIGQGSFGAVYEGYPLTGGGKVAIKVEIPHQGQGGRCSQLQNEFETYRDLEGVPGFPRVHYFGRDESGDYLVMDMLGISLEEMLGARNRRFCAKTVFIVAKKMIGLVEKLHLAGRVHRDLKPDNFLIGEDPKDLFLIDFGMAKRYVKKERHISLVTGKKLTGTPRYASVNAHKGMELSRRDDLESIGYIVVYLTKGSLPWQGIKENNRSKCRIIGEKKGSISLEELCGDMPSGEMVLEYLSYARGLGFEDVPDYDYLKGIFDRALTEHGLVDDGAVEWEYVFRGSVEYCDKDTFGSLRERPKKKFLQKLFRFLKKCFKKKE